MWGRWRSIPRRSQRSRSTGILRRRAPSAPGKKHSATLPSETVPDIFWAACDLSRPRGALEITSYRSEKLFQDSIFRIRFQSLVPQLFQEPVFRTRFQEPVSITVSEPVSGTDFR